LTQSYTPSNFEEDLPAFEELAYEMMEEIFRQGAYESALSAPS
jgi:hypothetical protein